MKKIFVSHAAEDNESVKQIVKGLVELGIQNDYFFIDTADVSTGENIVKKIDDAIANSEIVILIYSNHFVKSEWCSTETTIAIKQQIERKNKRKIYVLKIEDIRVESSFLDLGLSRDLFSGELFEKNIPKLAKELSSDLELNIPLREEINNDQEYFDYLKYLNFNTMSFERINPGKFDQYSQFFSQFSKFEGEILSSPESSLFDRIADHITNSPNEIPLLISGNAGSGKSTLLAIFFLFLWEKYSIKEIKFLPTFIDINNYDISLSIGEATLKFEKQLTPLVEYTKKTKKKPIIILDGLDDYLEQNIRFYQRIIHVINSKFEQKVIIGLSTSSGFFKSESNFILRSQSKLILEKIGKDIDVESFVNLFSGIFNLSHLNETSIQKVKTFLSNTVSIELDFFLMLLLCNNIGIGSSNINSICHLFNFHIQTKTDGTNESLQECSKIAFEHYVNKTRINTVSNVYNQWKVVHSNSAIRDYLIAFYLIETLLDVDFSNEWLLVFNHVYPASINGYCKEIINQKSYPEQKDLYDTITSFYNSIDITGRSHFCYILGRFEHHNIKPMAIDFLKENLKNEIKSLNESHKAAKIVIKQKLLLVRTIYISLAYLNDKASSDEYVNKLIYDKFYDNINRGFHLEYYGDIPYDLDDPEALTAQDDLRYGIDITFNKLYTRLKTSVSKNHPHTIFSIELYTLCSLIQHRHIEGQIDHQQIKKVLEIVNAVLNTNRFNLNGDLKKYLEFFRNIISDKNIVSRFDLFKPIYKIKSEVRAGWNRKDKGRSLNEELETVASHMYACVLLAKFFLPESLPSELIEAYPNYDKDKIIQILLFHDLAEYKSGDIPTDLKKESDLRDERSVWEHIAMLTSYEKIGNLTILADDWEKLENQENEARNKNINYSVANDIDKLENMIQLLLYKFSGINVISDFEEFFLNLYKNVRTEFGREILTNVLTSYRQELSEYNKIAKLLP